MGAPLLSCLLKNIVSGNNILLRCGIFFVVQHAYLFQSVYGIIFDVDSYILFVNL